LNARKVAAVDALVYMMSQKGGPYIRMFGSLSTVDCYVEFYHN